MDEVFSIERCRKLVEQYNHEHKILVEKVASQVIDMIQHEVIAAATEGKESLKIILSEDPYITLIPAKKMDPTETNKYLISFFRKKGFVIGEVIFQGKAGLNISWKIE